MGQLHTLSQVTLLAPYYFNDAYYSSESSRYIFKWPSTQYPEIIGIHLHHFERKSLYVEIREWIEDHLIETVIVDNIELSYKVVRKGVPHWEKWDKCWDINNEWLRLHFRKPESAVAFKLRFSEYIQPITEKSPTDDFDYDVYEVYKR